MVQLGDPAYGGYGCGTSDRVKTFHKLLYEWQFTLNTDNISPCYYLRVQLLHYAKLYTECNGTAQARINSGNQALSFLSSWEQRYFKVTLCTISLVPRPTPQGGRVWEISLLGAVQLECHGFWIQQTSSFRSSTRLVLYCSNFQNFYVLPYICFLSLVELERWLAGLKFFPSSTHPAAFRPSRHFRA